MFTVLRFSAGCSNQKDEARGISCTLHHFWKMIDQKPEGEGKYRSIS